MDLRLPDSFQGMSLPTPLMPESARCLSAEALKAIECPASLRQPLAIQQCAEFPLVSESCVNLGQMFRRTGCTPEPSKLKGRCAYPLFNWLMASQCPISASWDLGNPSGTMPTLKETLSDLRGLIPFN
jgi:hypothetical protein